MLHTYLFLYFEVLLPYLETFDQDYLNDSFSNDAKDWVK